MNTVESLDELNKLRNSEQMALFYFSRPSCGVCSAIKPKVINLLKGFPEISSYYVNLDEIPEAAGQLSVLTIPAVLAFADGKEIVREARYIAIDDLQSKISRPYSFIFGD